jgi:hypothetical protein
VDIANSVAIRWSYPVGHALRVGGTRLLVSRTCYVQAACFTQLSPIISCEVDVLLCVRHLLVIPCIVSVYALAGYSSVLVGRGSCLSLVCFPVMSSTVLLLPSLLPCDVSKDGRAANSFCKPSKAACWPVTLQPAPPPAAAELWLPSLCCYQRPCRLLFRTQLLFRVQLPCGCHAAATMPRRWLPPAALFGNGVM